jgi:hypothetical protein
MFGVWMVVFTGGSALWLYFKDPALLAERMRIPGTAVNRAPMWLSSSD